MPQYDSRSRSSSVLRTLESQPCLRRFYDMICRYPRVYTLLVAECRCSCRCKCEPITVLAPTNEAMARWGGDCESVLLQHIICQRISSRGSGSYCSAADCTVRIEKYPLARKARLGCSSGCLLSRTPACDGYVYVIDDVLTG